MVSTLANANRAGYQIAVQVIANDQQRVASVTQAVVYDAIGQIQRSSQIVGLLLSVRA